MNPKYTTDGKHVLEMLFNDSDPHVQTVEESDAERVVKHQQDVEVALRVYVN